jgi:hypothetical protein
VIAPNYFTARPAGSLRPERTAPNTARACAIGSWHVIGFGDQAGPEENTLAAMLMGFAAEGHPGHVFRDLT